MGATLDKSRDFGEVSGDLEDGTRFFQDDKRFDGAGNEIEEARTVVANTKKARAAAAAAPVAAEPASAPIATTVDAAPASEPADAAPAAVAGATEQLADQLAGA